MTSSPRLATNPANAILNYLYALLEVETVLACQVIGLDPGLGVFHRDRPSRASLALDLLEAIRPTVDAYLLALVEQRTLAVREFAETRRGVCRLSHSLARELTGSMDTWAEHIAPVVEGAAGLLADGGLPTKLTEQNRVDAWEGRRSRRVKRRMANPRLPSSCRDCGAALADRRRRYCDACRARRFAEHGPAARQSAAMVLSQLRADGRDPGHGGRAAAIRGRKNAAHQMAIRSWSGPRPDPAIFEREILPGLRQASIGELTAASGLSEHYCSLIRLGKRIPHPRHWETFKELGSAMETSNS